MVLKRSLYELCLWSPNKKLTIHSDDFWMISHSPTVGRLSQVTCEPISREPANGKHADMFRSESKSRSSCSRTVEHHASSMHWSYATTFRIGDTTISPAN
jgi:hypothetical protein